MRQSVLLTLLPSFSRLSGETANGEHPTAAVTIMAHTCCEAESAQNTNMLYQAVRNSTLARYGTLSTSESIASSAVKTAIDVKAKALIVCSESGTTATQVAKFRPNCPIYVLTATERVARQCSGVLRGSNAILIGTMTDMEPKINELVEGFKKDGTCSAGDAVVVVTGTLHQSGSTNLMRVCYAVSIHYLRIFCSARCHSFSNRFLSLFDATVNGTLRSLCRRII